MALTKSTNQGYITEDDHYKQLSGMFEYVTDPKNSGGGSDFLIIHKGIQATIESKTSNTDIFDAGVLSMMANGQIIGASSFLLNGHVKKLQHMVNENIDQIKEYVNLTGARALPHTITVEKFNDIKNQKKLIHICGSDPLEGIIESSFLKTYNKFIKANYIVIGDNVYCVSASRSLDPLKLLDKGAAILDDSCINKVTIRSARSGTRNGIVSVAMRAQFRLNKMLPETAVKLSTLRPPD